jgi:electron transfer flavoprotein beta subunit
MSSPLKVLVCVKRVIDPNVKVNVRSDGTGMNLTGLRTVLNPFDEVAIEEAVLMREKGVASEVVAVSVGPAECREVLRTAMALGADRSILVDCGSDPEPLAAARYLAAVIRQQNPDVVIAGKQSTDQDLGQTPGMLAALLDWPQALQASIVECTEAGLRVTCELDRGTEVVDLPLPALVSADLRLNVPRYATLPAVMKAKKKPMDTIEAATLQLDAPASAHMKIVGATLPAARGAGKRVADTAELVNVLQSALSTL